jgi:GNAT superfamily N-acetyltransferase
MSPEDFNHRVDSLWAAHFGCQPGDFDRHGTTLLPRDHLRGEALIHVVYLRRRALAELDPALEAQVGVLLADRGDGALVSCELLQQAWGRARIASVETGLIFHLRPGELVRPRLKPGFNLGRLSSDNQAALDALRQRCTEYEIEDSYVEIEHEIAWGCFQDGRLAAVGSGYRRNGFMDIGVLTAPELRGQGLARHVVRALADDTLELGLIPQYRCNQINQASRRVAEGAGFTLYFTTESVKVKNASHG